MLVCSTVDLHGGMCSFLSYVCTRTLNLCMDATIILEYCCMDATVILEYCCMDASVILEYCCIQHILWDMNFRMPLPLDF